MSTRSPQILVSNIILQQKKPVFPREMADSSAGQEINNLSLEHVVAPESKEVTHPHSRNPTVMGICQRGIGAN